MPEFTAIRPLPLRTRLTQGYHGAPNAAGPQVKLAVRHPLSIVTIIARKGQVEGLSAALQQFYGVTAPEPRSVVRGNGIVLQWCGPEQYFAIAEGRPEGALYRELKQVLNGLASLSDQSHGRMVIGLSGAKARALLSKGSPVDFHARAFPEGGAAMTQMAHVGVHVSRTAENSFEISFFRGFSESFWEWLTEQAEEFGYEVA